MKLCSESDASLIDGSVLDIALKEAAIFAKKAYGTRCVTCAQVYGLDGDTFSLHITSPGDLLINTSATMTFRKATAVVLDSAIGHSCHVHYTK
jgi:hypothetical protein